MEVSLVMVKADGSSKEVKLDRPRLIVGRDESASLRIPLAAVSRKHCEIATADDELIVRDLGSSNGTLVNGERIKERELAPGDLLTIGSVVFVVRIDGFPKKIDAADSYAAGIVSSSADAAPHAAPATGTSKTVDLKPPPGKSPAPAAAPGKKAGEEDLDDLLKDFDFGDDDDDERPASFNKKK
ncbi:MAG: FHA domain-containing protein [Phycisphaerae bacterium]|nr:FHA domain-containing protein [Phycisphaerae bacterium]